MRARRLGAGPRGWGGVGAMAVVCVLALAFVLLLPRARPHTADAPAPGGRGAPHGTRVEADACKDGEAHHHSLSPSDADGPTLAAIRARGHLRVGVDQNSYRWGYRNPNNPTGELEGFDIDLAHRIAEDILGDRNRIRFKAIPTNERTNAIEGGHVDMVVRTMTINCDRMKKVAFSAPYFLTGQQVLAPRTSRITGYDASLAGRKVCSATGSTAYDRLSADRKNGRIPASTDISATVPNQLDCLVKLQLGEVDAVVTDGALAAGQAAQDPAVALKGKSFTREFYGVAMKQDADDLVRRVNRILEDYREDGSWKTSYDKWLSATLGRDSSSATPPTATYR